VCKVKADLGRVKQYCFLRAFGFRVERTGVESVMSRGFRYTIRGRVEGLVRE